ncbi:MAG: hypothetical protein FD171_1243 [Actinobacteria bacterium]|nr:MAG: hypothetical protein FD171_1243 [Actinomycetota bacterium]
MAVSSGTAHEVTKPSLLRRALGMLWRFRFTISMLTALRVAAWMTGTRFATITTGALESLGVAPRDLWQLEIWRALTSAVVTDGGAVFHLALLAVLAFVGSAEWLRGSLRTALTFWGVHLATLLIESFLVALPLHLSGDPLGTALVAARDVGPSAGYFGCLGLVLVSLPVTKRVRLALLGATFSALVLALIIPLGALVEEVRELSANIAHMIALPLGALSSIIGRRRSSEPG